MFANDTTIISTDDSIEGITKRLQTVMGEVGIWTKNG